MRFSPLISLAFLVVSAAGMSRAQGRAADSAGSHGVSMHFQQTFVWQNHTRFKSPYQGANSLAPDEPPALTLTSSFLFHASLGNILEIELDPELSGGKGVSGSTGVAGFPNGEAYRVSDVAPKLELVRAFGEKTIPLGTAEFLDIIVGKFSLADYFDRNSYSNNPRTQFMNWALINNGAWDYPADTRGYTGGVVAAYERGKDLTFRVAATMEPTTVNGPNLDANIAQAHGLALETELGCHVFPRDGRLRVLLFHNTSRMGDYRIATVDSLSQHDIALTRAYGGTKYGIGLNIEQSLNERTGIFFRAGWNDGQHETWAYTEIDRTVSGGIAAQPGWLGRSEDWCGIAFAINGISDAHIEYLRSGGLGFIIGDGKLPNYSPETIIEAYYQIQLDRRLNCTLDYQGVLNPAYNRDRGPVNFGGIRIHFEL